MTLVKSAYHVFFLFLNQNICCGYGSFERTKHMLKLIGKKIFIILRSKPTRNLKVLIQQKYFILPVHTAIINGADQTAH